MVLASAKWFRDCPVLPPLRSLMAGSDDFLQWNRTGRTSISETAQQSQLRPMPTRLTAGPMNYSSPLPAARKIVSWLAAFPGRASQIRWEQSWCRIFGNLCGGRKRPRWAVVGLYPFPGRAVMAQQHVRRARTAHFSTNARLPSDGRRMESNRVYQNGPPAIIGQPM